jgi:FAD-linked sulfhydryl oxidase
MARRQHLTLTIALGLLIFISVSYLFSSHGEPRGSGYPTNEGRLPVEQPAAPVKQSNDGFGADFKVDLDAIPAGILEGESIAPKLENATLKAELGRATWKFLHTMVARFPDEPTTSDRTALETFIHLFGRLYPCGECARHFRQLLAEYPPQTSSRNAAAGWLCFAHNVVNERLEKPIFDCNNIGDFYDCGCGEEGKKKEGDGAEEDAEGSSTEATPELELEKKS